MNERKHLLRITGLLLLVTAVAVALWQGRHLTADDYQGELGHIVGSLNIPLEELESRPPELTPYLEKPITLVCTEDAKVTVFLLADAVVCANRGQKVPQGFYNMELMLNSVARKGEVLLCGTCMDARGITDEDVVEEARRSTMKELAERTLTADKVLVF
ncbi:MAG: DsrE family protein [Pseudomonadota bacterium]